MLFQGDGLLGLLSGDCLVAGGQVFQGGQGLVEGLEVGENNRGADRERNGFATDGESVEGQDLNGYAADWLSVDEPQDTKNPRWVTSGGFVFVLVLVIGVRLWRLPWPCPLP